jgi:hypothetical protein
MPSPASIPGGTVLDGPPPAPGLEQGMNPGMPIGDLMGGAGSGARQMGADQLPPEVLTGMQQAADTIRDMIDGFAQITPNLAPDWAIVKAALESAMSKVQQAGAGPVSPISTGPGFPGGGLDRGGLPLASGGI